MTSDFQWTALREQPESNVPYRNRSMSDLDRSPDRRDRARMRKLDQLSWSAGVSFQMFGVGIGVRVNREEFLAPLISRVPMARELNQWKGIDRLYSLVGVDAAGFQESCTSFNVLYGDTRRLADSITPADLYEAFESDLEFYVAQTTRKYVFVHAGVVAWGDRAIVIPGRSHSGKTTLVQALLQEGATYYSDEFAVLDWEGRVHPFPRPLSVRTGQAARRIPPAHFGASTGNRSLLVGTVVLTQYTAGARWKPNTISSGQGMLGLLQNTFSARLRPELAFETLGRSMSRAQVLGGTRGEAHETAKLILMHLKQESE